MKSDASKKSAVRLNKCGILGSCAVASFTGLVACVSGQQTSSQYADFFPVSVSIGCQVDTPEVDRLNVKRAEGVNPGILPVECVDRKKSVSGIYPEKIGVVHNKAIDTWSLVLLLQKGDAPTIDALSEGNIGRNILISADDKVVAKAVLNGPIVGRKIYISVDSQEAGESMGKRFIKQH